MKHEAPTQTLQLISSALALLDERIGDYEIWQALPCACRLCTEQSPGIHKFSALMLTTTFFIDDLSESPTSKRGLFCETHGLLGFHKDGLYYSTVGGELVSAATPADLAKAVAS